MKSEFKAKFIQHMIGRKGSEQGFTLIELLVVIIIIGILAAIALPSFLNQAAKAKQSEAKNYIGSINRAQQAYRIENPVFASNISDLELGLTNSTNYSYTLSGDATTAKAKADPTDPDALKKYSGGVVLLASSGQTNAIMCEAKQTSTAAADAVLNTATGASCPGTYKKL